MFGISLMEMLLKEILILYIFLLIKIQKKIFGFFLINVVNYKNIINLCKRIYEFNSNNFQFDKPIQVSYCKIQGKINLSKIILKNNNIFF